MTQTSKITLSAVIISFVAAVGNRITVVNEIQNRRLAISTMSSIATIATTASNAKAIDGGDGGLVERERAAIVPGVPGSRARLQNVVIDENNEGNNNNNNNNKKPLLITQLGKSRIGANELSPLNPSLIPFATDNELYYDRFLFGTWDVTSTLKRKTYPYGTQYLPSSSLYDGSPRNRLEKPGDTTSYQLHYFSSSSSESSSDGEEAILKLEKGKNINIIADRSYNAKSISKAYKQLSPVNEVQWDYKKDPTRLTIQFGSLAEDFQPLGERRGEVYVNARKSESGQDPTTGESIFCASERLRSVMLLPGDAVVSDTETITEYRLIDGSNGNEVQATSRIAVYLTPNPNSREGLLWQDVGGKAVAFFDYNIHMKRVVDGFSKTCVLTPHGGTQCGSYYGI